MSLPSVQQAQLPCARSNSFLDHKSKSCRSSTTTWRRGRSTRRSLLLRVRLHPQFHFTHRQLLRCTSVLPRAHRIEKEAALRDHGNCKLSCLFLSVCLSSAFFSQYLFLPNFFTSAVIMQNFRFSKY